DLEGERAHLAVVVYAAPPRHFRRLPVMGEIHAEVLRGNLINVAPVRAAKYRHGHTLYSFHRLIRARVFPTMNFCAAIGEGQHATASMPTRWQVVERLTTAVPIQAVLTDAQVIFMHVHEHTQLGSNPACKIASL